MAEDYSTTIAGMIIGGRGNTIYGAYATEPEEVETDEKKQTKQGKCKNDYGQSKQTKKQHNYNYQRKHRKKQQLVGEHPHPLGAISLAYSFTPQQYQYPPLPPHNYVCGGYGSPPEMAYGGHDYYGGYHGQGYSHQFPPPYQGDYNYGMGHNYSGAHQKNMRSLPDHGGAAATGAPVYGYARHDTANKQLDLDHSRGGAHVIDKGLPASGAAAAGAAANGGHGQRDAVKSYPHHESYHGGGQMAMGGAATAAATTVYSYC